jgi:CRP-like cAMP-binding protein
MNAERIANLQQTPVFGGLNADSLELLVGGSRPVAAGPGDFIVREGELGDKVYLLEDGRVEVLRSYAGEQHLLKELGPGDCFGEMALLDISPRSASVRALTACSALEIPSAALFQLYEHDVEQFSLLTMNMGREVSRRLRETEKLLER